MQNWRTPLHLSGTPPGHNKTKG
uniref:Uncharacterized protein n=1 Tax=Arundo donax TaxID=35708 RepID=A0A0A8Z9A3_ARUDO